MSHCCWFCLYCSVNKMCVLTNWVFFACWDLVIGVTSYLRPAATALLILRTVRQRDCFLTHKDECRGSEKSIIHAAVCLSARGPVRSSPVRKLLPHHWSEHPGTAHAVRWIYDARRVRTTSDTWGRNRMFLRSG